MSLEHDELMMQVELSEWLHIVSLDHNKFRYEGRITKMIIAQDAFERSYFVSCCAVRALVFTTQGERTSYRKIS